MANLGLYLVDVPKTLGNDVWVRRELYNNKVKVLTTSSKKNNHGAYVANGTLYIDGEPTAANTPSSTTPDTLSGKTNGVNYGSAEIQHNVTEDGELCINVTLDTYNRLLAGEVVPGYKRYDPYVMYNIVSESELDVPVYFKHDGRHYQALVDDVLTDFYDAPARDGLYNNLQGFSKLEKHELDSNTYTYVDCPKIGVYDPPHIVPKGSAIDITYMVDTAICDKINYDKVGNAERNQHYTFTVIIKDAYGNILYENTTYAGVFKVRLKPFQIPQTTSNVETWFSIEAIDWRGCGSTVRFVDICFEDTTRTKKIYNATIEDLTACGIVYGSEVSQIQAYDNKVAFTDFLNKVKTGYYNNTEYDGVKFPANYTFYLDYHKNLSDVANTYDFGGQTYYITKVETNDGVTIASNTQIVNGEDITIEGTTYTVNKDPLLWIMEDGAHLYRTDGVNGVGKIKVWWRDEDDGLGALNPETQEFILGNKDYLDTKKYESINQNPGKVDKDGNRIYPDGYYYTLVSTSERGDEIVFPNNFIIDLNGCTIKGYKCYDLDGGYLILLDNNEFVTIKNGNLVGIFDDLRNEEYNGRPFGGFIKLYFSNVADQAGQGVSNIGVDQSKYCVFENIDSSFCLGYDSKVRAGYYGTVTDTQRIGPSPNYVAMDALGYIDQQDGSFVELTTPIKELDNDNSREFAINGFNVEDELAVNLICDSNYIPFTPKYNGVRTEHCYTAFLPADGVCYVHGKQHEFFISFYKKEGNTYTYIKTIKTSHYEIFKAPLDCTHIKCTGYGLSKVVNDERVPILKDGHNIVYQYVGNGTRMSFTVNRFSRNVLYKNCYWHDTRSTALSVESADNVTRDSCIYDRIADTNHDWGVTSILGASEDGRLSTGMFTIKNCEVRTSPTKANGNPAYGQRGFALAHGRNVCIANNIGLTIDERSRFKDVYVHDNIFDNYNFGRSPVIPSSLRYYVDNSYTGTINSAITSTSGYGTNTTDISKNRTEEPMQRVATIYDSQSVNVREDTNSPKVFRYKRSRIGGVGYE